MSGHGGSDSDIPTFFSVEAINRDRLSYSVSLSLMDKIPRTLGILWNDAPAFFLCPASRKNCSPIKQRRNRNLPTWVQRQNMKVVKVRRYRGAYSGPSFSDLFKPKTGRSGQILANSGPNLNQLVEVRQYRIPTPPLWPDIGITSLISIERLRVSYQWKETDALPLGEGALP